MKTIRILLALALCATTAIARADDRGGRYDSHVRARRRAPKAMHLKHGAPMRPSGAYRPPAVRYDVRHAPIRNYARPAVWHAPNHNPIIGLAGFTAAVFAHEAVEVTVGHTYWHTSGSVRYAHYYDGHVHWYGFYDGPRFYWTRYEDQRWWWFDEQRSRWLYSYGGYWWWQNPANAAPYVVINDNYYPYSEVEEEPQLAPAVAAAPPTSPSTPAPAPAADAESSPNAPPSGQPDVDADATAAMKELDSTGKRKHVFVSPDGTREVDINGPRHEAFLYDRSGGGNPQFIALLATGARKAQFSEPASGKLQILLLMRDGSYDVFDGQGRSLLQPAAGTAPAADSQAPAPPPDGNASPDNGNAPPDGGAPQEPPSPPPAQ